MHASASVRCQGSDGSFFWVLGKTSVMTMPTAAMAASAQKAASLAPPESVRMRPIKSGPKCPPKLPTEFTNAMPAAAAVPDKNAVGNDQKVDTKQSAPAATKVSAIKEGMGEWPT